MDELKIIIKAVATAAKKELEAVKDKLNDVKESGDETGRSMGESMKNIAKHAAVATTAVTAISAAMVGLGQKSLAAQKEISKLTAAFQAAGSTAKQAQTTYTGLYRFLGDAGQATEAANHLAMITTNAQDLAEWTKILQGVWATFGSSLPIESLTEAANETMRTGVVTSSFADALNWAGVSESSFNEQLAQTTSLSEREALMRSTLNSLYMNASKIYERNNQALLANAEAQARLDAALAQAYKYLAPLMTAFANLATTLLTYFKPALEVISAVLITLIQYIITAIKWLGSFFSIFSDSSATSNTERIASGVSSVASSARSAAGGVSDLGESLGSAAKAAKELRKQTMGFDELNIMSSNNSGALGGLGNLAGGVGAAAIPDLAIPEMPDFSNFGAEGLDNFQKTLDKVKEHLDGILVLVGLIGASFAVFKIAEFADHIFQLKKALNAAIDMDLDEAITPLSKELDSIKAKIARIGGTVLLVAGSLAMVVGYSDAWANGVDWGNLALVIGGAAAAIAGLNLVFGSLAMSIGLITAGIAAVILGMRDFIENGISAQNTILMIGGAVAIAVGLATGGLSTVTAAIAGAVVAVGAFVAAIMLEEPAIMSVKDAQDNLTNAINNTIAAENKFISATDKADASMKKLTEAEAKAGITGKDLYKQVENGTLTYADMTDAQREVYKAYLDNEQAQKELKAATEEFNKAKKAETIASYENQLALAKESGNYDDYKASVIEAFKNGKLSAAEARDLISKSMSEMSDDAQKAFMEDIPSDIKNGLDPHKYETTKTKFKKWFGTMWTETKNIFSDVGDFFKKVGTALADAVTKAVKAGINGLITQIENKVNGFIRMINGAIGLINKIPGVNISKMGTLSFPRLAEGGIATSSVIANIGEAGKEAVLPLERNTEWMDILAKRINGNTPSKIVLNVDGKELGWASINSINGITEQTGGLQLVIC